MQEKREKRNRTQLDGGGALATACCSACDCLRLRLWLLLARLRLLRLLCCGFCGGFCCCCCVGSLRQMRVRAMATRDAEQDEQEAAPEVQADQSGPT
ncbi:GM11416 [Drosophila sechellia]|uniref:GM11416 n=1 Tax=Drosophila sechellia TaxID=7238 RepID=B4IDN8_DROSE|nr:GM11416 [Drosophila sechellia]